MSASIQHVGVSGGVPWALAKHSDYPKHKLCWGGASGIFTELVQDISSLDVQVDVSKAGWGGATDGGLCLTSKSLVSRNVISELGYVAKIA